MSRYVCVVHPWMNWPLWLQILGFGAQTGRLDSRCSGKGRKCPIWNQWDVSGSNSLEQKIAERHSWNRGDNWCSRFGTLARSGALSLLGVWLHFVDRRNYILTSRPCVLQRKGNFKMQTSKPSGTLCQKAEVWRNSRLLSPSSRQSQALSIRMPPWFSSPCKNGLSDWTKPEKRVIRSSLSSNETSFC